MFNVFMWNVTRSGDVRLWGVESYPQTDSEESGYLIIKQLIVINRTMLTIQQYCSRNI